MPKRIEQAEEIDYEGYTPEKEECEEEEGELFLWDCCGCGQTWLLTNEEAEPHQTADGDFYCGDECFLKMM